MSESKNMPNSESLESENEVIIEGELESTVNIYLAKAAIEENAKLYGPLYKRLAVKHALNFESRMLNEKPPENIQELDAVVNYILANLNRYPRGHCALIYAISKTESELQGHAGTSGSRRAAFSAMKNMLESVGMLNNLIGITEDIIEACKLFKAKMSGVFEARGMQVKKTEGIQKVRYVRGGGKNEAIITYTNCPYKDTCRALLQEGVSRIVGGSVCINLILGNAITEIITRKRFDYALEEFDKPDCKGRIFEV
ncbi:MAG: hypothetical protein QXO71_05380 [Candidatus Jordarchaeaceae archaeon]